MFQIWKYSSMLSWKLVEFNQAVFGSPGYSNQNFWILCIILPSHRFILNCQVRKTDEGFCCSFNTVKIFLFHLSHFLYKVSWKKELFSWILSKLRRPPPLPNLDNLYHFFWTPMFQKLGRGLPLPIPIPKLTQYTVCEKWTKNLGSPPPPHLDKIQKNSYFFFRETFPYIWSW